MNNNAFFTWLVARLQEQSTWKGIIGLITAAGVTLKPEQAATIISAGMALMALINVFRSEQKQADAAVQRAVDASPTGTLVQSQQKDTK